MNRERESVAACQDGAEPLGLTILLAAEAVADSPISVS